MENRGFLRRLPLLEPWAAYLVTDWGEHGKRLESQVWNFCGRKRNAAVFELSHSVPAFDIRAAARLLESNIRLALPNSIFVCVVDPEVGSQRKAIAVEGGNKSFFVGPHNGVFDLVLRGINYLFGIVRAVEIDKSSKHVISPSEGGVKAVDGDAIFSPAAGAIIRHGKIPKGLGREIPLSEFGEVLQWEEAKKEKGEIIGRVEETDPYGTFVTNIPSQFLSGVQPGSFVTVSTSSGRSFSIRFAEHFAAVEKGEPLILPQGNAFLHIAVNCGKAKDSLPILVGEEIRISP